MQNPHIIKFLEQYDESEWDRIVEDLIIYGINKIKETEIEEEPPRKVGNIPKINSGSEFISFNRANCGPYEYATNILKQNAELKSNPELKTRTVKKLDELNKKISNIQSGNKTKKVKKIK